MGVNFSTFEIGQSALRASQFALNITGQNIANVNTPGYARQTVQLAAVPGDSTSISSTGNGVSISAVSDLRDNFVEARLQAETATTGRLTAQSNALAPVDSAFTETSGGQGISSAMSDFFNSFSALEQQPGSLSLRATVVDKGAALGAAFSSTRAQLVQARTAADGNVRSTVDSANKLASEIASLNGSISTAQSAGASASELVDQRTNDIEQLAGLTGARALQNADGTVTLTLADGQALVEGTHAATLQAVSTPPDGLATITLNGAPVNIGDGQIRGLLDAIGQIGGQINALDQFAGSLAQSVNALHSSGSDLNGANGGPFFAVPANGAPITAANLDVSAAIKADPSLVVASARGAGSGDTTVARSIYSLLSETSSQVGSTTGSFSSIYASMVTNAGSIVQSASDALTTQQAILSQTTAQRDSTSGVSLDDEAINLLQYQRSYEAAAKFLKTADEMTQTILSLGQ